MTIKKKLNQNWQISAVMQHDALLYLPHLVKGSNGYQPGVIVLYDITKGQIFKNGYFRSYLKSGTKDGKTDALFSFPFFFTHFKHLHILSTALLFTTLVKWFLNTGPVNPVSCGPPPIPPPLLLCIHVDAKCIKYPLYLRAGVPF